MDTSGPEEPEIPAEGRSYWARWQYTPQEWHLFDQRDWHSAVRSFVSALGDVARFYVSMVICSAFLVLILTIVGLLSPPSPLLLGARILGAAAGLLILVLIFVLIDTLQLLGAWKRHWARQKELRQVIIGSLSSSGNQAIWVGEQSVSLQNPFLRLSLAWLYEDISSEMDEQRDQSELVFSRFLGPLNIDSIDMIRVVVPQGHEEEARRLVERFNQKTVPAKKRHRKSPQSA